MPSAEYYRNQANLFFRMSLACGDPERAAQLEAQARLFLNLAGQSPEPPQDLNTLLDGFNDNQLRKPP
jgi:hypothetical protein